MKAHLPSCSATSEAPARAAAPRAVATGPSNAHLQGALEGAEVETTEEGDHDEWGAAAAHLPLSADQEADPDDPAVVKAAEDPEVEAEGRRRTKRKGPRCSGDTRGADDGAQHGAQEGVPEAGLGVSTTPAPVDTVPGATRSAPPTMDRAVVETSTVSDLADRDAIASSFLDERARHQALAGGDLGDLIEIDAGALIRAKAGGGAKEGALGAGLGVATDTVLDVATSKVPFVSGFIELGKIAMDPKNWVLGIAEGTAGNFAKSAHADLEQGGIGAAADFLEAALGVVDGVTQLITTIAMILTIGASLCFAVSWIPGLQFLGAIAAVLTSFAVAFGTVGTLASLFVTLGHSVLMNLRIAEIELCEHDPAAMLDAADSLENHTQTFVSGAGTRMLAGGRERGQKAATSKKETGSSPSVEAVAPSSAAGPKQSTGKKVAGTTGKVANVAGNALVGAVGGGDSKGKGGWFTGGIKGKAKETVASFQKAGHTI